ncbi:GNAT family N-acetyltransferase [Alkalicoccus saliphilus]|uniref:GNAT family N-acetyltransferase n=1 Tax=Alkalicoccus saliphilus TaxID=200989 RepID=A0A2T4U9Q2_9BACI|nr:GNAT family protein [Alkalicoccus saliphilus]PTL40119.1 GNAT family N-acetyltransferase [Alkalicoccus saliphilus]
MIILRSFQPEDDEKLIKWINSPELLVQWGGSDFNYPLTKSQLEKYRKRMQEGRLRIYSAVNEEGEIIGHISLDYIDKKNESARICRVLIGSEADRGQGKGQEMMRQVLHTAFEEMQLHRVSLGVFDFNLSAAAAYKKVGFVKEGRLRDKVKVGEEFWSLLEMSMLSNEWKKNIKNEDA